MCIELVQYPTRLANHNHHNSSNNDNNSNNSDQCAAGYWSAGWWLGADIEDGAGARSASALLWRCPVQHLEAGFWNPATATVFSWVGLMLRSSTDLHGWLSRQELHVACPRSFLVQYYALLKWPVHLQVIQKNFWCCTAMGVHQWAGWPYFSAPHIPHPALYSSSLPMCVKICRCI